jgi:hypothetical protein
VLTQFWRWLTSLFMKPKCTHPIARVLVHPMLHPDESRPFMGEQWWCPDCFEYWIAVPPTASASDR